MPLGRGFLNYAGEFLSDYEMDILVNHVEFDNFSGKFTLHNTAKAKKKWHTTRFNLRDTRNLLEGLATLYELLVLEFPDKFK